LYIAYGGFDSSYYLRAFIELSQLDRSHVSARKLAHSYQRFQSHIAYGSSKTKKP